MVIFLIDALRADRLGVYGYQRRPTSPCIDALAREAVVFDHAAAPAPWTLPSVASLLTATFPCEHNLLHDRHQLAPHFTTLPGYLKPLGYTTISLYANPFVSRKFGLGRDFDATINTVKRQTDGPTLAAALARHRRTPYFIYIHNTEPHNPYDYAPAQLEGFAQVPEADREWFAHKHREFRRLTRADFENNQQLGSSDNSARIRRLLARFDAKRDEYSELYDAAVRAADQRVDSVIDELKARGLWEQTLFILVSDHGEEFGEHGGWLHDQSVYEELVRVPLIMRFPRGQYGGQRIATPVSLVDIAPTILDYLGSGEVLGELGGVSLLPLVRGEQSQADDFRVLGMRMNRKKYYRPWKIARGDDNIVVRRGPWKGIWNRELDTLELYNLAADPDEQRNLSGAERELTLAMQVFAQLWFRQHARAELTPPEREGELDADTLRDLRALGYID